jgi:glycosyltransferase involved in cell wall biosynthesis
MEATFKARTRSNKKATGAKSKVRIAAIICTYNRYDVLDAAITSCIEQDLDAAEFEIIIVDNSPDHAEAEKVGRQYRKHENLSYLIEKTPGLANARNVGARKTEADIVAFLDDDAIAKPDWLRMLVKSFDDFGDKVMVAGGKISPIWDAPRPSWLGDNKLGHVSVVDWGGSARPIKKNEWIAGANISFLRSALLEVGGFNTSLGRKGPETSLLNNEESDVIERLTSNGGIVLYIPEAEVDHLVDRRRLNQEWFRRRSAWQGVSDILKDPSVEGRTDEALESALNYLLKQPPRYRSMAGLSRALDDADEFNDQLDAIYNMTIATLSGFKTLK